MAQMDRRQSSGGGWTIAEGEQVDPRDRGSTLPWLEGADKKEEAW